MLLVEESRQTQRRMAVTFAFSGQPVRSSERKCRPPYRALFPMGRAMAGLSLHEPRRMRQPIVEVAWVMRREYCEHPKPPQPEARAQPGDEWKQRKIGRASCR